MTSPFAGPPRRDPPDRSGAGGRGADSRQPSGRAAVLGTDEEDKALVERVLAGDTKAFEPLIDRYQTPLFNAALRLLRDEDDARDVVQTAFVKAYQKLDTFDPQYRFFSWIYRITHNEALNLIKKNRRTESLEREYESEDRTPLETAAVTEMSDQIESAMRVLTFDYRCVLILRHFLGFSHREMSEALEVPEKTVKSRLHTARRRLQEALQEHGVRSA